jgi:hypothetical protein
LSGWSSERSRTEDIEFRRIPSNGWIVGNCKL